MRQQNKAHESITFYGNKYCYRKQIEINFLFLFFRFASMKNLGPCSYLIHLRKKKEINSAKHDQWQWWLQKHKYVSCFFFQIELLRFVDSSSIFFFCSCNQIFHRVEQQTLKSTWNTAQWNVSMKRIHVVIFFMSILFFLSWIDYAGKYYSLLAK